MQEVFVLNIIESCGVQTYVFSDRSFATLYAKERIEEVIKERYEEDDIEEIINDTLLDFYDNDSVSLKEHTGYIDMNVCVFSVIVDSQAK